MNFVERSLVNLETDALDLVQLHCPPTEVFYNPEVFGILDDLKKAGKIRWTGVSLTEHDPDSGLEVIETPGRVSARVILDI